VTAVEYSTTYLDQAEFVLEAHGLRDRVDLLYGNVFAIGGLEQRFDIVCYVGLSYHLRHPQLALDLIGHRCAGTLLASSQTIEGDALTMQNRAMKIAAPGHRLDDRPRGYLYGWEPTEELFLDMIAAAGFRDGRVVSTSPHAGESPGRRCGNRTYCVAQAPTNPVPIAVVDDRPLRPRPPA
jgi:hypothetical protein